MSEHIAGLFENRASWASWGAATLMGMPVEPPEKNGQERNIWLQIGRYSHLALALPASVAVGIIVGATLDHWLKTSHFTLIGLLLGAVAGLTELIRAIIKMGKHS